MRAALVACLALAAVSPAGAQPAADPRAAALVSTDPIRCWWQSDAGAVTIGQSFSVTLTCAVIDTDAIQVVPDESRLGVATVQVAPFEILGGSHPSDAKSGARRFFQYQYTLRLIDRDVIGRDIKIPSLPIQYRVRSRMNSASTLEGRDLTYVMPSLPIKVLSLVPAEAADIRDGSEAGFGAIEGLRFRASLFRISGVAFGVMALIGVLWALAPWVQIGRRVSPESTHHVPDRVVLREVGSRLAALKAEANREWTDELVARALSLIRLVSSYSAGRPISQHPFVSDRTTDARFPVVHGVLRPARVTVSSSMTADDLTRAIASLGDDETSRRGQLETLRSGLTALSEAAYRPARERDFAKLDEALSDAIAATSQLASDRTRLREWMSGLQRSRVRKATPS